MTNPTRLRLAAAVSPFAMALSMTAPSAAWAQAATVDPVQDQPAAAAADATQSTPADAASEGDNREVVVTGFRAALQSAVSTKKRNDQIVESVSAEDIGKLPDASISESIARLPGLTSQRLPGGGRSSLITVRGLGPDFTATTLNGRLQTSTNDVRAVEYDQYPSEVVSAVDVYKTPNASLIGQGLSASVDIRTIRPLAIKNRILAVGVKGIYAGLGKLNPDSKKFGYRVNGTYVDQFFDGRLGIALSGAYVNEPYQTKEERGWGWPNDVGGFAGDYVLGGLESYNSSSTLKRLGLTGTVQYEISDELMFTADGFYSKFKDDYLRRGVEIPLAWGGATLTNAQFEDGVLTSGTFSNVPAVVNNKAAKRHADLFSFGGNLKYDGHNGWKGSLDIGWSKTDRKETDLQTNAGTGPGNNVGANDTVDIEIRDRGIFVTDHVLDYSDPSQIFITDANGWGGGAPGGRQHGYLNNRLIDDEIIQFAGDLEREFGGGFLKSVRAGLSYSKRDKSLTPDEYYLRLTGGALQAQVPSQYLLDPVDTWVGLGPMLTYDPNRLLEDGFLERVANPDVFFKAFQLTEKITSGFVMLNLNHEYGAGVLTGNIGVRAERTKQSSDGFAAAEGTERVPFTDGDKYWDVLPSANLAFRFNNDFVVRIAAAREIQRPRMDDMATRFDYGYNINTNIFTGSSGNPRLRPYRANAFDATIEKYWGTKGYIALQGFYKKLKSYIFTDVQEFDFSGLPLPSNFPVGADPANVPGFITQPLNGKGGTIYGAELAGTIPFESFTPALTGFGVTGGVSWTKSRVHPAPNQPADDIPGFSRWVGNATAYYENSGFSIRGSMRYRSSYIGDFQTFDGVPTRRRVKPETIFDAQVGYEVQEGNPLHGLSLFLQGQNLTNEPFVSYDHDDPAQILNYHTFGRRFMFGATYKFAPPRVAPAAVMLPPPPPPAPPATQTCADGTVVLATEACPVAAPPPPPPVATPERG